MNKLLLRQLSKLGLSDEIVPSAISDWQKLLKSINALYDQFEEDRYLMERSLQISSNEMRDKHEELKSMAIQLAETSKVASLGTLAAGVAHELNNPLAIIRGFTELCIEINKDQNIAKNLSKIIKSTDRMASIIGHLKLLARKSPKDEWKAVDLVEAITDSMTLLTSRLRHSNVTCDVILPEVRLHALGDHYQIASVIQNIILNSCDVFELRQITRERKIKISVVPLHSLACIRIEDNAGGIDAILMKSIFDPFVTTKPVGSGPGLGLSLAQRIILDHSGTISAENMAAGAAFVISIPMYDPPVQPTSPVSLEAQQPDIPKRFKIMIVDDEPDLANLMKINLQNTFDVTVFTDSQQALNAIQQESFDFVVTDLKMPVVNGLQILDAAKSRGTGALVVSGHAEGSKEHADAFSAGALSYIRKPFKDGKTFCDTVRRTFEHAKDQQTHTSPKTLKVS